MTDTTRDLIQRLAEKLDHLHCHYNVPNQSALISEARSFLSQPEPEGPTDRELTDTFYGNCRDTVTGLRAVLARWGRPATPTETP